MLMKAGTETLRDNNRALVLATLRKLGPVSHTDIAEWTGLSSATVSVITAELVEANILLRLEKSPTSGRGRPRVQFCQNPQCAYIAAVRISVEKVEYSLVNYAGVLQDRFEIARQSQNGSVDDFFVQFKAGLDRLAQRANLRPEQILRVSITSKGLVALGKPVLLWSQVFGAEQIDFEALLKPDWHAQVSLTNETQFSAKAVAEIANSNFPAFTAGKFATLSLGQSIGLGIATKDAAGRVTSYAPPFNHMTHQPDGPLCRCGLHGCIESYSGFYGILRTAYETSDKHISASYVPLAEMDKLAARARAGERMARYAFNQAGEILGIGISRLYSFLGIMPVTITGAGMHYFDLMREEFEKSIRRNLQIQFESMPKITTADDESNLVFNGNIQTVLENLDNTIMRMQQILKDNSR